MALILDGTNGLSDVDGTAGTPAIRGSDDNTGVFFGTDIVGVSTGGSERMRVDASGNVGIGTSSPRSLLNPRGSGATGAVLTLENSNTALTTANIVGQIDFFANDASANGTGAKAALAANVEDATGTRIGLTFATSDNTSATGVERMRIDSSGNLLVGATANSGNARMRVVGNIADDIVRIQNDNAAPYGLLIYYGSASPNSTGSPFFECYDSTAQRATIRSNGGLANYSANNVNLSDRREKTNFAPAGNYLSKICAIPVQTFNYIDQNLEDDADLTLGVVAQDVQEVAPELVMESNWGTKEEPKQRLSIYQTDLQYALMKAIQELKAINDAQAQTIESLTARVVALEGA